jgi:hypothetical protein
MAGYITVRQLIDNLMMVEDLDSPVIYQYYLGEHFDISDTQFAKVAGEFESLIPCLSDAHDVISQACAEVCCEHDAHENYCECCMSNCEKCSEEG